MKQLLIVLLLGIVAAGCSGAGSVYPIYTGKDIVFLPELVGTWAAGENEKDVAVIAKGEDNAYIVKFWGGDGSLVELDVHLTKIGGKLFADAFVEEYGSQENGAMIMPVHMFACLPSTSPELKLAGFDMDWLEAYLTKHPRAIRHLDYGDHKWIYFTDTTKHVRKFLKKALKIEAALVQDDTLVFRKISDSQELPPRPEKKEKAPETTTEETTK